MVDISNLEAAKIQERLLKDDDVWWALINLDLSSSKPKAIVAATGNGGVEQLKQNMADDLVQYGAVKVLGVDVKGAVTSTRLKIIFFQWVGPNVPRLKVAKALPAKAAMASYFQGHHVALELYDKSSLTEADLEARLRACGGAHQPSDFKFGSGSDVTVSPLPPEPSASSASGPATPVATAPAAAPASSEPVPAAAAHATPAAAVASGVPGPKPTVSPAVEAQSAVVSIGKAASALNALIAKSGPAGSVTVADLKAYVAAELGEAAVAAAAALSAVGHYKTSV